MTDVGLDVLHVTPFAGASILEPEADGTNVACKCLLIQAFDDAFIACFTPSFKASRGARTRPLSLHGGPSPHRAPASNPNIHRTARVVPHSPREKNSNQSNGCLFRPCCWATP